MTNADHASHITPTDRIANDSLTDRQWLATGGLVVGVSTTAIALSMGVAPVLPLIVVGLAARMRSSQRTTTTALTRAAEGAIVQP